MSLSFQGASSPLRRCPLPPATSRAHDRSVSGGSQHGQAISCLFHPCPFPQGEGVTAARSRFSGWGRHHPPLFHSLV